MKLSHLDISKEPELEIYLHIILYVLRSCYKGSGTHTCAGSKLLFHKGVFPDKLKLGNVVPIHKSGYTNAVTNYRTIVIQSVIAKVFNGLMLDRLSFCLGSCISSNKLGFCPVSQLLLCPVGVYVSRYVVKECSKTLSG